MSSSSDDIDDRVPFGPSSTRPRRPANRPIKRVFVHLLDRPRYSPRGGEWNRLEREGLVKTLAFDRSQTRESLVSMLKSNFPSLAQNDFQR